MRLCVYPTAMYVQLERDRPNCRKLCIYFGRVVRSAATLISHRGRCRLSPSSVAYSLTRSLARVAVAQLLLLLFIIVAYCCWFS